MGRVLSGLYTLFFVMILMLLLAACSASADPEVAATLVVPTGEAVAEVIEPDPVVTEAAAGSENNPPPPTFAPTALPDQPPLPTETPATQSIPVDDGPLSYRVAYVEQNDVLNVRLGPGVEFEVVAELQPGATDIVITGQGQLVEGSVWIPIETGRISGWVNSLFLTQNVKSETACDNLPVQQLMSDFNIALSQQDNNALANLIHPERGVHVHYNWWSDEVWLRRDELDELFSDDTEYNWGTQAGSGNLQIGSFSEIMLPILQDDLLAATEQGCNEILNGATAGLVTLPDGFEQYNYLTFYRPFPEGAIEFDWGSWVVGFEEWDGVWYITYLVHFEYEI